LSSSRAGVLKELAALSAALEQSFPASATDDGWTVETWLKWRTIFQDLHRRVAAEETVTDASISRAMDFDGIVGGELLERAARVSNALRALGSKRA
jgi:hypothetical protein